MAEGLAQHADTRGLQNLLSTILLVVMMFFSAQLANSQRAISFEEIENARDMGSLAMQDGRLSVRECSSVAETQIT
jgi:hypothetical protein